MHVRIDSSFMRNGAIVDTIIVKPLRHRRDLVSSRIINIYPDTMCWIAEFTYSFNEPAMQNYFAHPSNGEYPVVGISWDQAHAFVIGVHNYTNRYPICRVHRNTVCQQKLNGNMQLVVVAILHNILGEALCKGC